MFLTPFFSVILLFILKFIVEKQVIEIYEFPNRLEKSWSFRCPKYQNPCYEFIYSNQDPATNTFTNQIMSNVKDDLATSLGISNTDVKVLNFSNITLMEGYLFQNPNVTFAAVAWNSGETKVIDSVSATSLSYTLYYNATDKDRKSPVSWMKKSIDNAALKIFTSTSQNKIQNHVKGFPNPAETEETISSSVNVYVAHGSRFLALPGMVLFLVVMQTMASEKEFGLRRGMQVMGMKNYAYLVSWLITYTIYALIVTVVIMTIGVATVSHPFVYGNPLYHFLNIFSFNIALVAFGLFLSTFFKVGYPALVSGFVILAMGDIMNATIAQGSVAYSMMSNSVMRHILALYPPMNFAKIFLDMSYKTRPYFDLDKREFVSGKGYGFGDLFVKNNHDKFRIYGVQESYISFLWQFGNIILYLILWWISDYAQNQSIFSYYLNLPFQKLFNRKTSSEKPNEPDLIQEYQNAHDETIQAHIRLVDIHKSFVKNFNLPKIGSTNYVLNGVNLSISNPGCYMIIGSSGKSTLFNILNATESPSKGKCYLEGIDVEKYPDNVRSKIGMAFEYDFLWQELTAWNHMTLFAELKGIPSERLEKEIDHRLKQVSLYHVRNHPVGSFSGGMKRRLSVALACIGDPPVLLLDLPTLGVDPSSRRKIWALIHELKENHVILATSHSVQECENLGTKIGILSKGTFKTFDDSLSLISRYQAGYSLNVITNYTKESEEIIRRFLKFSEIQNTKDLLHVIVKQDEMPEMIKLMEFFENNPNEIEPYISDWNISQATLEEVYKNIMKQEKNDLEVHETSNKSNSKDLEKKQ